MNICMIGFHQYPIPPLRGGSLAIVAYDLITEFAKKGHYVSVLSLKDPLLPNYEEKQRIRYYRIRNPIYQGDNIFGQSFACLNYSFFSSIKIDSVKRVDVIQCFDPLVLPFLKWFKYFKKKPTMLRFGMGFGLSNGWDLLKRPNWFFLKLADRIVVPSQFLKRLIITNLGLSGEQISIIPNGVNLKRFNPKHRGDMVRRKFNLGDSPVILFVGRISPEKGLDLLLESMPIIQNRVRDVKLLVAGSLTDGPYTEQLKSIISKLRLHNVIFTGGIDVIDELPKVYAACNVFCSPSVHGEAFGNVAVEAMASGKPVVVTRSGGFPEIVENGKVGTIITKMRKEELAQAIIEILESEILQKKMGTAARKRAEESFSWDSAANRYLKLYKEVIEKR